MRLILKMSFDDFYFPLKYLSAFLVLNEKHHSLHLRLPVSDHFWTIERILERKHLSRRCFSFIYYNRDFLSLKSIFWLMVLKCFIYWLINSNILRKILVILRVVSLIIHWAWLLFQKVTAMELISFRRSRSMNSRLSNHVYWPCMDMNIKACRGLRRKDICILH